VKRFLRYVNDPEFIKANELNQFDKKLIQNALKFVPAKLLDYAPSMMSQLVQEIFVLYVQALKTAIVEYITKSPDERRRLHIMLLPSVSYTAAE
jgi:dynein heavy chain, axonemal